MPEGTCRMDFHLRVMTSADIPAGMRLKEIAGWNQTRGDWKRFLRASPAGCFVAESEGPNLVEKPIEYLDGCGIPSMKLDATPQGKPLYEKLGFVSEYEIERWH